YGRLGIYSRQSAFTRETTRMFGKWALATLAIGLQTSLAGRADQPRSREFLFTYEASVIGLSKGQPVRIWIPLPPSNKDQNIAIAAQKLPAKPHIGRDSTYGNRMMYLETQATGQGTVPLAVTYRITRREVVPELPHKGGGAGKETADDDSLFLRPNAK